MIHFSLFRNEAIFLVNTGLMTEELLSEVGCLFPARLNIIREKIKDYKSEIRKQEILLSRIFLYILSKFSNSVIEYYDRLFNKKVSITPSENNRGFGKLNASISHSLDWVAIGVSPRGDIGIDIVSKEKNVEKIRRVEKRFLSNLLSFINSDCYVEGLVWSVYESFLKIGISDLEKISIFFTTSKELNTNKKGCCGRVGNVDGYFFRVYNINIKYPSIIASMVVRTNSDIDDSPKLYLVKEINPRERELTRVLHIEELS